jgi:hypothetical protein
MTFELVYFETNQITRKVEASTLEEAIGKASQIEDWADCEEESLGTAGVEEAYVDGVCVYSADGSHEVEAVPTEEIIK